MKTIFKQTVLAASLAAVFCCQRARAQTYEIEIKDGQLSSWRLEGPGATAGATTTQPATVSNAVKLLRDIYPDVNIMVEPGVGPIIIGDCDLRSSKPDLDLDAFSFATGKKFICHQEFSSIRPPTQQVLLMVVSNNLVTRPVPEERRVVAFNLTPYCAITFNETNQAERAASIQHGVDNLKSIILTTVNAMNGSTTAHPPEIEFYPEADLLIVIGSTHDLQAARTIVAALPGMFGSVPEILENPGKPNFVPQIENGVDQALQIIRKLQSLGNSDPQK